MYVNDALALGVPLALAAVIWRNVHLKKESLAKQKESLAKSKLLEAERARTDKAEALIKDAEEQVAGVTRNNGELVRIFNERYGAIPWLAELAADLYLVQDERQAQRLETKKHPARNAAEVLREHAREKKQLRVENRTLKYRVLLIEYLFPWMKDIGFEDAESVAAARNRDVWDANDPASEWLSKDEWEKLPITGKYQRALERYKNRKKSNWEIGRDFERFIGYGFEKKGYNVVYHGAIKGFDDFGRDLIVTDAFGKTLLIQCKRWSIRMTIPEAAIFQLFGSTVSFYVEKYSSAPTDLRGLLANIEPWLYATTQVAPRIRKIAGIMGVQIKDDIVAEDWPMIKCNLTANGDRIYHLPMDQQYDRVMINKREECYVSTVEEAVTRGFRRAKRWLGDDLRPTS